MSSQTEPLITGLHHINLLVPPNTLPIATNFYSTVLGFTQTAVPASCKAHLAWFNIGSPCPATFQQQLHITSEHFLNQAQLKAQSESPRHPCFKVPSAAALEKLQKMIWKLYEAGGEGAPVYCDQPGKDGERVAGEFPARFFARDYAGNRLEFSL